VTGYQKIPSYPIWCRASRRDK